jgi:hypothetical protein
MRDLLGRSVSYESFTSAANKTKLSLGCLSRCSNLIGFTPNMQIRAMDFKVTLPVFKLKRAQVLRILGGWS